MLNPQRFLSPSLDGVARTRGFGELWLAGEFWRGWGSVFEVCGGGFWWWFLVVIFGFIMVCSPSFCGGRAGSRCSRSDVSIYTSACRRCLLIIMGTFKGEYIIYFKE